MSADLAKAPRPADLVERLAAMSTADLIQSLAVIAAALVQVVDPAA
jgi:hypothetical protein